MFLAFHKADENVVHAGYDFLERDDVGRGEHSGKQRVRRTETLLLQNDVLMVVPDLLRQDVELAADDLRRIEIGVVPAAQFVGVVGVFFPDLVDRAFQYLVRFVDERDVAAKLFYGAHVVRGENDGRPFLLQLQYLMLQQFHVDARRYQSVCLSHQQ